MKKREGLGTWMCLVLTAVAVMGMSLLLVEVAGAASYTITVTQNPNGTISPGTSSVLGGTDKAFTITPSAGYAIRTLKVDTPFIQPSRTYKFTKVGAPHSITATFALDSDNDGIPDEVENQGITVWGINYPPCAPTPPDRTACVDKASKDLFVVLVPAVGGRFSTLQNPLEYVTRPGSGLPVTVHLIVLSEGTPDTSDRFLSPNSAEKYVRITESLNPDDPRTLGSSTCGTPDGDLGIVFTQRIVSGLTTVLGAAPDSTLRDKYIKHTIAHELGHMVGPLAPANAPGVTSYHYPAANNDAIMDQWVYCTGPSNPVFTCNPGPATFYIGTSYTSYDQAGIKLK
jgi:hypothetical protein